MEGLKGDSLRHDYVVPPPLTDPPASGSFHRREALTEAPSGRGLPTTEGGGERGTSGQGLSPRVILSEAKPEGQIALQFGSREKVLQELSKIPRRSRPSVDPADFDYGGSQASHLRSG